MVAPTVRNTASMKILSVTYSMMLATTIMTTNTGHKHSSYAQTTYMDTYAHIFVSLICNLLPVIHFV